MKLCVLSNTRNPSGKFELASATRRSRDEIADETRIFYPGALSGLPFESPFCSIVDPATGETEIFEL